MDGTDRSVIVPSGVFFSNGITVFNDTVYWTQMAPMAVMAMDVQGTHVRIIYQDATEGN